MLTYAAPAAHTRGSSSCEHDDKSFCDEENSFRDEQNSFRDEQTSFCSRALFRFEVAAEPAEASTRAHGRTTYWPAGREQLHQPRRFDGARGQAHGRSPVAHASHHARSRRSLAPGSSTAPGLTKAVTTMLAMRARRFLRVTKNTRHT